MNRPLLPAACLVWACAFSFAGTVAALATPLTNGNFETEASPPAVVPTGWTAVGTGLAVDSQFGQGGSSYDVSFTAFSTDPDPGVLSQTVSTTTGMGYTLSFWLLDENLIQASDAFKVNFGGMFTQTVQMSDLSPADYTNVVLTIPAGDVTGPTMVLSFQGLLDLNGLGSPINLDTVSLTANVVAAPEPSAGMLFGAALGMTALLATRRRAAVRR